MLNILNYPVQLHNSEIQLSYSAIHPIILSYTFAGYYLCKNNTSYFMKIISKTLLVLSFAAISLFSYGQGYISSDYMTSSSLKDENGNRYGSGDLLILSGRYTSHVPKYISKRWSHFCIQIKKKHGYWCRGGPYKFIWYSYDITHTYFSWRNTGR